MKPNFLKTMFIVLVMVLGMTAFNTAVWSEFRAGTFLRALVYNIPAAFLLQVFVAFPLAGKVFGKK